MSELCIVSYPNPTPQKWQAEVGLGSWYETKLCSASPSFHFMTPDYAVVT